MGFSCLEKVKFNFAWPASSLSLEEISTFNFFVVSSLAFKCLIFLGFSSRSFLFLLINAREMFSFSFLTSLISFYKDIFFLWTSERISFFRTLASSLFNFLTSILVSLHSCFSVKRDLDRLLTFNLLSSKLKKAERSSSASEVEELSISSCPEHSKLLDDVIPNWDERKSDMSVPRLDNTVCNFFAWVLINTPM